MFHFSALEYFKEIFRKGLNHKCSFPIILYTFASKHLLSHTVITWFCHYKCCISEFYHTKVTSPKGCLLPYYLAGEAMVFPPKNSIS